MEGTPVDPSPGPRGPGFKRVARSPVAVGRDGWEGQIVVKQERDPHSGQLCQFAVCFQVRRTGETEWQNSERIDNSHGQEVHLHEYQSDGTSSKNSDKLPTEVRLDLDSAFRWAVKYIWTYDERIPTWL